MQFMHAVYVECSVTLHLVILVDLKLDRKDGRGSALLRGTHWWSIPLPFSLFGRILVADDLLSTNTLAIMLSLFLCASSGVRVLVTISGGRGATMDGNADPFARGTN